MTDAIVITCYRSPRTTESRIKLLKSLNPDSCVCVVYTGNPGAVRSFGRVFEAADFCYEVPTRNTKDNWFGLDRALLRWWVEQGRLLKLNRILFLDWDVLILESATSLLNQLSAGKVLFTHVFPVVSLDDDHWARDFLMSNADSDLIPPGAADNLSRAFLFSWACFASDLEKVALSVATLSGYCEIRLPFAFRSSGVLLGSFAGVCNEVCNVFGEGISLARLRVLKSSWPGVIMAHPVYLPVASPSLKLDAAAFLLDAPYLKTWERKLKKFLRTFLVRIGLLPHLNP
jgi:hypothetical protein